MRTLGLDRSRTRKSRTNSKFEPRTRTNKNFKLRTVPEATIFSKSLINSDRLVRRPGSPWISGLETSKLQEILRVEEFQEIDP